MLVFEGLGKGLRWLRARQDKRQYEVAELAGVTKAMLSAYETGKQKPSLETLEKILGALGADLVDLHDALSVVNDRPGASRGDGQGRRDRLAPLEPGEGPVDVYRVLGLGHRLPPEEERAFAEMLTGFHRLVRYMHRSLEEGAGRPRDG
jgi:transcriptional regulator with XRE-family HTH domain